MKQEYTSDDGELTVRRWHDPRWPVIVSNSRREEGGEAAEKLWSELYPRAKRLRELRHQWRDIVDQISLMGHMKLAAFAERYDYRDCKWIWLACVRGEDIALIAHDWAYRERIDSWNDDTMLVAMTIDELRERL